MASVGIDRRTGLPLADLAHVAQSVDFLLTTRLGEYVMLGWFGGGLPELLGRRVTPTLLGVYRVILTLAINAWEPRLDVVGIDVSGNTTDALRLGDLTLSVLAFYRPRGHLGDLRVDGGLRRFSLAFGRDAFSLTPL